MLIYRNQTIFSPTPKIHIQLFSNINILKKLEHSISKKKINLLILFKSNF